VVVSADLDREANGGGHPARGYSWPPFENGNQAARTHGGYSLLGIGDRATEIADDIRPTLPAYAAADEPVLLLLATTLARIERANAAIEAVDAASEPLGGYLAARDSPTLAPDLSRLRSDLRSWINTARRLANDLGLTPTSRARLGLDLVAAQRIGGELLERYGGRVA
jgi:hypothetical protein